MNVMNKKLCEILGLTFDIANYGHHGRVYRLSDKNGNCRYVSEMFEPDFRKYSDLTNLLTDKMVKDWYFVKTEYYPRGNILFVVTAQILTEKFTLVGKQHRVESTSRNSALCQLFCCAYNIPWEPLEEEVK